MERRQRRAFIGDRRRKIHSIDNSLNLIPPQVPLRMYDPETPKGRPTSSQPPGFSEFFKSSDPVIALHYGSMADGDLRVA